jgi:Putative peptidoglycan binding domain
VGNSDARDEAARPTGPTRSAQVTDGRAEARAPEQTVGDRAAATTDPARGDGHAAGGLAVTGHRRRGRGWVAAVAVVVVVAAGAVGADAAGLFQGSGSPGTGSGSGYKTGIAAVRRGTLTEQTQQNGTLGNAGSYTVVVPSPPGSGAPSPGSGSGSGSGTYTWLPAVGQTIRQGHVLYRVSGTPVVLLYGRSPAYRSLSEGMTGRDVRQLNTGLVKLGYATAAAVGPRSGWNYFSGETAYALEQLQSHLGLTVTGTLPLGQAAFLPGPAQVNALGTGVVPGAPATAGSVVLTATSVTPVVTIDLDASLQGEVKAGDKVSITLPSGAVTPGVITQVSNVAMPSSSSSSSGGGNGNGSGSGSGSGTTITVLVSLTHPKAAGHLNQAPVEVTITTGSASNVLTVPVNALLAQPGDRYAVEVTGPGGHHLVRVTPGVFDDAAGRVQVTGNLTPGQHVVVPGI